MTENDFHDYRRANDTKVDKLNSDFIGHTAEERARDAIMLDEIKSLTIKVEALICIWDQAKGAIVFVKWMAAIVAASAAVWTWLSTNVHWK